jgi:uncharacterized protein YbaR (Trm112 family)
VNLDPALLEILACPKCHADLRVDEASERLVCTGCGLRYPVRDDIPVMLIDEAEQGSPGSSGSTGSSGAAEPGPAGL